MTDEFIEWAFHRAVDQTKDMTAQTTVEFDVETIACFAVERFIDITGIAPNRGNKVQS